MNFLQIYRYPHTKMLAADKYLAEGKWLLEEPTLNIVKLLRHTIIIKVKR
jgi:hypothetical protein